MKYFAAPYDHRQKPVVGILLMNLGTPEAPTAKALRPYLRQFLSDPRVIELPRLLWWCILNFAVLPFRPKRSAKLYQNIWTAEGSPLLVNTRKQTEALRTVLARKLNQPVAIEYGMRYGSPSIAGALRKLAEQGVDRLLLVPLYPQYSATTTASTFDAVFQEFTKWRLVPQLRFIRSYHDNPAFIEALARSVEERWNKDGRGEKLLISFHGIPEKYLLNGDPYFCHCHKTGRLLAERLRLKKEEYAIAFQSLFGQDEWLRPYTNETIEGFAKGGIKSLDVICPGFSSDCLETIDEIDRDYREVYEEHGGKDFRYIPALNDRPDFIEMLSELCRENMFGWLDKEEAAADSSLRFERYKAQGGN